VYTDYAIFDIDREQSEVRVRETFGVTVAELASRMSVELR
jgi:3-oxoadipate CoA-transferase beta subunit